MHLRAKFGEIWPIFVTLVYLLYINPVHTSSDAKKQHGNVPLVGNALAQYNRYVNITSKFNSKATWKLWTDCINELSRNGGSNDGCTSQGIEEMRKRMASNELHNEKVRSKKLKPDCKYHIVLGGRVIEGGGNNTETLYPIHVHPGTPFFTFDIKTGECKSAGVLSLKGGASFEIKLISKYNVVSCASEDTFKGEYKVVCPLHPAHLSPHSNDNRRRLQGINPAGGYHTLQLSVTLDFEHYDAFSDVYAPSGLLDWPLFHGTLQLHHRGGSNGGGGKRGAAEFEEVINVHSAIMYKEGIEEEQQKQSHHTIYGHWSLDGEAGGAAASSRSRPRSRGALADFHWRGTGEQLLSSKKTFLSYFGEKADKKYQKTTTHLVGASHMRYYWDFYYYLYYGAKSLGQFDRKHGYSYHIPHLVLESILFATDMGDYFARLQCPAAGEKVVYVFQFSSWDLQFSSLRNLMDNPDHLGHLAAGIEAFIKKCSKIAEVDDDPSATATGQPSNIANNVGNVHLVWLGPTPYPKCPTPECKNRRRFNNHYAGDAVLLRLTALVSATIAKYTTTKFAPTFDVINVRWMASVKMERRVYPCHNHLLCHPEGETMLLSRPGIAVAGAMLQTIQRIISTAPSPLVAVRDPESKIVIVEEKKEENKGKQSLEERRYLALHAPSGEWFLLVGGLLRRIPDAETLSCLNQSVGGQFGQLEVKSVTVTALADYPMILNPLPSRKEGTKLAGENTPGSVWKLQNDCTRRFTGASSTTDSTKVLEMDLEDIPTTL